MEVVNPHLVRMEGEPAGWTIECFDRDAERECAVLEVCPECGEADTSGAADLETGCARSGDHVGRDREGRYLVAVPESCALAQTMYLADGALAYGGWMTAMHQNFGEGVYLVSAELRGEAVVGAQPIRVVGAPAATA